MKMTIVQKRLAALREVMQQEHLGAFIVPSTDPHGSEYVPEHWKCREWLSGFNGSTGTLVVTAGSAAMWTDSRYFIAASEQLTDTGIELMKERVAGIPVISQWIGEQLADTNSKEVGIDGMVAPLATVEELKKDLRKAGGLTLRTNLDPFATVWKDRPPLPVDKVCLSYMLCWRVCAGQTTAHSPCPTRATCRRYAGYGARRNCVVAQSARHRRALQSCVCKFPAHFFCQCDTLH